MTKEQISVAFLDPSLNDIGTLYELISPDASVFILTHETPILSQIAATLSHMTRVCCVHIFTHGRSGEIVLGERGISLETLPLHGKELENISKALDTNGEIYLYGCEVAAGERGAAFVKMLSDLTGLKVAAATHKVGHTELGGSWELDFAPMVMSGALEAREWRGVLINNSPVLDNTKSPALGTIAKNLAAPTNGSTANSILVSDLINTTPLANYSDADSDPAGIAITGVNSNGTLWFSTNGGATWTELTGTVSGASALTLHADADTRIYFQPDTDYTGDLTDAITFKAWDRTDVFTNGQTGVSFGGPSLAATVDTVSWARAVTISGNYAYVAAYDAGLKIVDISNPLNPSVVGTWDTSNYANGVAISGNYAYVADYNNTTEIIDISNSASPSKVTEAPLVVFARDVAVSGTRLFEAAGSDGLHVINITNPASPVAIGRVKPGSSTYLDVAVSGNYAYVGTANGLMVVNHTLVVDGNLYAGSLGFFDNTAYLNGVAVSGGYLYAAANTAGLKIYSLSNPESPSLVGSLDVSTDSSQAISVTIDGNYAYITDSAAGLHIIDISNPASPSHVATYDSNGEAIGVAVSGNHAYLADKNGGLKVIDISDLTPSDAISADSDTASLSVVNVSLAYGATTFTEASDNDGSIDTVITVTLTGDTFTGANDAALAGVTVNNVPAGLTAVVTKKTDTTAEISFTGSATTHANANDIADLEVVFADAAFTGGGAASITNSTKSDLVIDFISILSSTTTLTTGPSTTGLTFPSDKVKISFWNGYNELDTWQNAKAYYDADSAHYETSNIADLTTLSATTTDLAFIFQPSAGNFSDPEIAAFQTFLDSGGRIFFLGEHNGYRPTSNAIISDAISRLGGSISVVAEILSDNLHDNAGDGTIELNNSPLMAGITSFQTSAFAPLEIDSAISKAVVVDDNSRIAIADQALSKGRVTVIADQNWLSSVILSATEGNQLFLKNLAINSATNIDTVADGGNPNEGGIENESNGNSAPVITSNGGGATAAINVAENSTAVTTVVATDADSSDTITYSITGGADQTKFAINAGVLTFASAPNYESPADSDTNNTYVVEVTANDGNGGTDVQEITVTVTDVNETPTPTPTPAPEPAPEPAPTPAVKLLR